MGYSIAIIRELYEKAYNDGLRANKLGNTAIAKQRFRDAAVYLKKLATLDVANSQTHLRRAEQLLRISEGLRQEPERVQSAGGAAGKDSAAEGSERRYGGTAEEDGREDMSSFYTFFESGDLTEGFESVIGLDEAKQAITEYVINPIRYPEAYNYKFMSSKCILLEGPPGTGKTTFAKAVAKEIDQPFALVNVASLINCYVGETGKTIDRVFDSLRSYAARKGCGITVFFDEFDEIARSRTGDDKASQTAVPALLRNLDGVKENKDFLILANTNCVELLDAGILSRFRRKIYIPLPDKAMRRAFFEKKLAQLEREYFDKLDLDGLSEAAEGMSGRAITQVCDDYLHFVAGVKAGLRGCDDFNAALLDMIHKSDGAIRK